MRVGGQRNRGRSSGAAAGGGAGVGGGAGAGAAALSSHLDARGHARMVDVGEKPVSRRSAVASASVRMQLATFERLAAGDAPKGDVLAAARIAGILGAKRTPELIPLCHPVATTRVSVEIALDATLPGVRARVLAEAEDRTGVEMEAMVGASLAALTVYDMLKGIDRAMRIEQVRLEMKQGGRSGRWEREGGG